MGKEIEKTALQANHKIVLILDNEKDWEEKGHELEDADVAIEFSQPGCAVNNIKRCFKANVPVVVGTTGWLSEYETIKQKCIKENKTLFYAANYSIGVNIFMELNRYLAQLMDQFDDFDVEMDEIHHSKKLDTPSGTAITLAKDIIEKIKRKDSWINSVNPNDNEIQIRSFRIGSVPGVHSVYYTSDNDIIEIRHAAKKRRGFSLGAVAAAEWVAGKKGVFGMKDMLNF
jgi:4-hydroxy-tetrahydrodipicolinate reductase